MLKTPQSLILPVEEVIKLKTKRLLAITSIIEDYKKEHEDLQKSITELSLQGERGDLHMQKRWEDIRLRLEKTVKTYFELSSVKAGLMDCEIRLRKSVGLIGCVFDWELRLPQEDGFGKHRQVISLNHLRILPAAYEEDQAFVKWMSSRGLIEVEAKLDI